MSFPAEKLHFPAAKCCFGGAHGRKPLEIAGGFQGSRIKNASQLSHKILSGVTNTPFFFDNTSICGMLMENVDQGTPTGALHLPHQRLNGQN